MDMIRPQLARSKWLAFLLLTGWAIPASSECTPTKEVPKWVQEAFNAYYAANDSGNMEAMMKLYAPDAVLQVGDEVFRGRDAIRLFLKPDTDTTLYDCTWGVDDVLEGEWLAAVSSHDSCLETPKSGGVPRTVVYEGGVTIYGREKDGTWLIVREVYGSEE